MNKNTQEETITRYQGVFPDTDLSLFSLIQSPLDDLAIDNIHSRSLFPCKLLHALFITFTLFELDINRVNDG